MSPRLKKTLKFVVRWGIAIVGVWVVVSRISLRDSVLLLDDKTNLPQRVELTHHADDEAATFQIIDPATKQAAEVDRARVINPISSNDKPQAIKVWAGGVSTDADLLGMRLRWNNGSPWAERLLVQIKGQPNGIWIYPKEVNPEYKLDVPRPKVDVGILTIVQRANPWLLIAALAVFPVTFMITSYRWNKLLEAVDVRMGLGRVFVINMVGAFYNTFMPGSTGGDVLKAYYASKQTPHRMRAVISVVIDRILGLLALVMLGGVAAAYTYTTSADRTDPTARACLQVSLASIAIMIAVGVGMAVLFHPDIRKWLGLEFILNKLPMQSHIENAREVTRIYRARPVLMLWAVIVTLPVHMTVVVSALLAGMAFGLPIKPSFYFTAVPVIVLVGSIPISPQGAGVMEVFAYMLTRQQGATVSQAVALTMSIRMVQVLWNLTGGIFVLRGGYHAPTEAEQRELEAAPTNAAPG